MGNTQAMETEIDTAETNLNKVIDRVGELESKVVKLELDNAELIKENKRLTHVEAQHRTLLDRLHPMNTSLKDVLSSDVSPTTSDSESDEMQVDLSKSATNVFSNSASF